MNKTKYILTLALLITAGLITITVLSYSQQKQAQTKPADAEPVSVTMYKRPGCQCCTKWAAYMEASGYSVAVKPTKGLSAFKRKVGVPRQAASCHTALINGYVVEGHVPEEDIKRLLKEQPDAVGIAAPGMPQGAPGMPSPNPQPYKVYLIGNDGSLSVYAQHQNQP